MTKFKEDNLSNEEAFWVMFYFLKEHYELSENPRWFKRWIAGSKLAQRSLDQLLPKTTHTH